MARDARDTRDMMPGYVDAFSCLWHIAACRDWLYTLTIAHGGVGIVSPRRHYATRRRYGDIRQRRARADIDILLPATPPLTRAAAVFTPPYSAAADIIADMLRYIRLRHTMDYA